MFVIKYFMHNYFLKQSFKNFFVTILFFSFSFFISASGDQSVSCSVKKFPYEWPEEEDFLVCDQASSSSMHENIGEYEKALTLLMREGMPRIQSLQQNLDFLIVHLELHLHKIMSKNILSQIDSALLVCKEDMRYLQRRIHPNAMHGLALKSRPALLHIIDHIFKSCHEHLDNAESFLLQARLEESKSNLRAQFTHALSESYYLRDELESLFSIFGSRPLSPELQNIEIPQVLSQKIFNSPGQVLLELLEGFEVLNTKSLLLCNDCKPFFNNKNLWCLSCREKNIRSIGKSSLLDALSSGTNFFSDSCGLLMEGLKTKYALRYLDIKIGAASGSYNSKYAKIAALIGTLNRVCGAGVQLSNIIKCIPPERLNCTTLLSILEAPHPTNFVAPHRVVAVTEGILRASRNEGNKIGDHTVRLLGRVGRTALSFFASKESLDGLEDMLKEDSSMAEIIRSTNEILEKYGIPKKNLIEILQAHGEIIDYTVGNFLQFIRENGDNSEQISRKLTQFQNYLLEESRIQNLSIPMSTYLQKLGQLWFAPTNKVGFSRIGGEIVKESVFDKSQKGLAIILDIKKEKGSVFNDHE